MKNTSFLLRSLFLLLGFAPLLLLADKRLLPDTDELQREFGRHDEMLFHQPKSVYYPEIWVNCLGGNLTKEGMALDLQAIAEAGFSGVQLFFGDRGSGIWPGVEQPIRCLTPEWDDFVRFAAEEAKRLELRFTLQNCPGWAMAGGPWITPQNAMRHLIRTETRVQGGTSVSCILPAPPEAATDWRDYQDLMVLAFPTPLGNRQPLRPDSVRTSLPHLPWMDCLSSGTQFHLPPTVPESPHWVEVTLSEPEVVRTLESSSVNGFAHWFCYEPGVNMKLKALYPNGESVLLVDTDMPAANWQDRSPVSLACREAAATDRYRIEIVNANTLGLSYLHLMTGACKNNWESEAGWTLRNLMHTDAGMPQNRRCYVKQKEILDVTTCMLPDGHFSGQLPPGEWTLMRIGHVNTGMKNAPAPPEATGWECNKFDEAGAEAHFAGYIGRLKNGQLAGLLDGLLLDSWECETQTWTQHMEHEFTNETGYQLRQWIPALFGYVLDDQETSARFLRDWRGVINKLMVNRFYKKMAELGAAHDLDVVYETAAGDVFPADIMEYFKYADVPMCEFWQHTPEIFVGSLNFKPIKPTVSAARLYGKPRITAEAFTSLQLTWDENFRMLKETANKNRIEGATHFAFQAYTHNPRPDMLVPGSSYGSDVGTPFLRLQTWWRYMPEFTTYIARSTYLLERGKPVSDVLWYLGDEINHKPDQLADFPSGYKYDYCNPDVLLTRLTVDNGVLVTPEGLRYKAMWLPENHRMLPQTLEKLTELAEAGAVIIGNAPQSPATLADPSHTQQRFDTAVARLWGKEPTRGLRQVGKGKVISGMALKEAIALLELPADVLADDLQWLHRQTDNADWYYLCAPTGKAYKAEARFLQTGAAELWNPVTGEISTPPVRIDGKYTAVHLDLARGESCFLVFRKDKKQQKALQFDIDTLSLDGLEWTLRFPDGWGVEPDEVTVSCLLPWKDLPLSAAGKAFSGTVSYETDFVIDKKRRKEIYMLDLGHVESVAKVQLNGKPLRVLWTWPYQLDLTGALRTGENHLEVEVTNTWFNRLVHDGNMPPEERKTWTIHGPSKDAPLRDSGLLGPVQILRKSLR